MADFELQGMPVWVYSKDADSKASIAPSRLVEERLGSTSRLIQRMLQDIALSHQKER